MSAQQFEAHEKINKAEAPSDKDEAAAGASEKMHMCVYSREINRHGAHRKVDQVYTNGRVDSDELLAERTTYPGKGPGSGVDYSVRLSDGKMYQKVDGDIVVTPKGKTLDGDSAEGKKLLSEINSALKGIDFKNKNKCKLEDDQ